MAIDAKQVVAPPTFGTFSTLRDDRNYLAHLDSVVHRHLEGPLLSLGWGWGFQDLTVGNDKLKKYVSYYYESSMIIHCYCLPELPQAVQLQVP